MRKLWLSLLFMLALVGTTNADTCYVEAWECTNLGCGTNPSCTQYCTLTLRAIPCGQSGSGIPGGSGMPGNPCPNGNCGGGNHGGSGSQGGGAVVVGGGVATPPAGGNPDPVIPTGTVPEEEPEAYYSEVGDCWTGDAAGLLAAGSAVAAGAVISSKTPIWNGALGIESIDDYARSVTSTFKSGAELYAEGVQRSELNVVQQLVNNSAKTKILQAAQSQTVRDVYTTIGQHFSESQALQIAIKSGHPEHYIAAKSMGIKFLGGGVVGGLVTFATSATSANAGGAGFYSGRRCK